MFIAVVYISSFLPLDNSTGYLAIKLFTTEGQKIWAGYIIDTLNFFYGLLDSYAKNFGSKVPGLGKIIQYLQIASFMTDRFFSWLVSQSGNCK